MRASTGIYIAVIAMAIGLATVITRLASPNNNFLASVLDVVFVVAGVLALEAWAFRRRRAGTPSTQGTATFLFTDVVGSTRLLKSLGAAYPQTLAEQEGVMRRAIAEFGGDVVDTQGDSVFARFSTAGDAVRAAVSAQHGLELQVRMGLHTGVASSVGGRTFGLGVHRAARICALADGGEILCSQTTHDLIADEEDGGDGLQFVDLGERELKDLDRPVRLYRVEEVS